jgi:hypothetical protein
MPGRTEWRKRFSRQVLHCSRPVRPLTRLRASPSLLWSREGEWNPKLRFRKVFVRSPREECTGADSASDLPLFVFDFRVHGHSRRWNRRGTSCAQELSRAALRIRTDSARRMGWLHTLRALPHRAARHVWRTLCRCPREEGAKEGKSDARGLAVCPGGNLNAYRCDDVSSAGT